MKSLRHFCLLLSLALTINVACVAQNEENLVLVDTIKVESECLQKAIKSTVVLPAQYFDADMQEEQYPVVYLLNGYGGDYKSWVVSKGDLDALASDYGVIFVCPDGQNSWYWDSPVVKNYNFESYIITELVPYIDNSFRTIPDKNFRAMTGLSMGGHGALWLAIRHSDVFGVAGSMSGGVNIIPFPDKWEMKKLLGDYATNKEVWQKHTVINLVPTLKKDQLKIIFDCGSEDFFYKVNCDLHEALLKAGIPHDFISRPGTHNWTYWTNSLDYQMLFFSKAFEQEAE